MQSCSTEEALLQNESNIQTVSREQAIQFLQQNPLKVNGNKTSKTTTLSNYDAITLEKITNSDQLLTVIPLPDSDKQQNSRVLLLTVNDTLKSVVFTMYPDVAQSTNEFSGRVLITSINGDFFKGFRMKNGYIISKFIKKPSTSTTNKIESKSTTAYATEPIELQEVIIPARKPVQSLTVAYLYVYSWELDSSSSSLLNWGFGGGGGGSGAEPVVAEEEDFEDKIDDSELNPCLTQVLLDLKNLKEGKIASIIKTFSGEEPCYNWTIKSDNSKFLSTTGSTSSVYDTASKSAISTFHPLSFPNATDLSWARTIMHEGIHAYLVSFFANDITKANIDFADLVVEFAKTQDLNSAHHEEFVRKFSSNISISLQEYGISKGYNLTKQFYDDMSWAGLYKTAAFEKLDNATKERIINVIAHEAIGKDFNGDSVIQNGTKIICNEQTN
jgi:hypothetical protein